MSIQNGYILDFTPSGNPGVVGGSGVLAYNGSAGASASVVLPAGIENLMLVSLTNAVHFRLSVGPSTAVPTDPVVIFQAGAFVVKLAPELTWTLSAIGDTATGGNLSYFRVMEA